MGLPPALRQSEKGRSKSFVHTDLHEPLGILCITFKFYSYTAVFLGSLLLLCLCIHVYIIDQLPRRLRKRHVCHDIQR